MAINRNVIGLSFGYIDISRYAGLLYGEFLYGGHVAAAVSATMVFTVSLLLGLSVNLPLLAAAYLSVLIPYSYDYHRDAKKDLFSSSGRDFHLARTAKAYPYILAFYVVSFIFLLIFLGSLELVALSALLAISGMSYPILFRGFTRVIPGFKNVYTSFLWAVGGVFFVVAYYLTGFGLFFLAMFLFIFLKVLINTVFYDVKDVAADGERGLKTLPVFLGTGKTVALLNVLNLLACIPVIVGVCMNSMPPYALSMCASCFSMAAYLNSDKGLGYARYILADAEILLWPILLLVGKAVYYGLY